MEDEMTIIYDFADINARLVNGFREPEQRPAAQPAQAAQSLSNFYQAMASGNGGLNGVAAQGGLQSLYNQALGSNQQSGLNAPPHR